MTMSAAGVPKLIEECGELQQVLGKKLAFWRARVHPDGSDLDHRLEEEMGDVLAAIQFCADKLELDWVQINRRLDAKITTFRRWDDDPFNNNDAIDGAS